MVQVGSGNIVFKEFVGIDFLIVLRKGDLHICLKKCKDTLKDIKEYQDKCAE